MAGRRRDPAAARARNAEVDEVGPVLEAALRFLEPRPRATAEVRRRLASAGYRADLIDTVVERLTDLGVLDDEVFAREWVRSRDRAHPRGERALRSELRAKGIADTTIAAILAERDDVADGVLSADEEAATRLLERKSSLIAKAPDPRQARQRAYALLVRNGFGHETAWTVARRAAAMPDDDPGG